MSKTLYDDYPEGDFEDEPVAPGLTDDGEDIGDDELAELLGRAQGAADEVVIDLSEAGDYGVMPAAKGVPFQVLTVVPDTSKDGAKMMKVTVARRDDTEFNGRQLIRRYMLSGKGAGFTKKFIEALGFTVEKGAKQVPFSMSAAAGREFLADIVMTDDGKPAKVVANVDDASFNDLVNPRQV